MFKYCKQNLKEIENLILSLSREEYSYKSHYLTHASIGQHVRHILEFYQCLFRGIETGFVNYDKRVRDIQLEIDTAFTAEVIEKICTIDPIVNYEVEIFLEGNFSVEGNESAYIKTSLNRELAYCLEHSIHHQALIKISLLEQNLTQLIDNNFGVAPATIRFKEVCAH